MNHVDILHMLEQISDKFGIDKTELFNFLLSNDSIRLSNVLKMSITRYTRKKEPKQPKKEPKQHKEEPKKEPKYQYSTNNEYQQDTDKRRKEKIEKLKYMFFYGTELEKIQAKTILHRKFNIRV